MLRKDPKCVELLFKPYFFQLYTWCILTTERLENVYVHVGKINLAEGVN
jgi:hypothetical protein